MNTRYDLVIFDLDGTMLNTSEGIMCSAKYAIDSFGLEMPDSQTLDSFIGPPIQNSFARVYGLNKERADEMAAVFRKQYSSADLMKATPYDGIYDLFQKIKDLGIKSAVATYKREDYTLKMLKHFEFDKYADIIHGSDMAGTLTKSDIIEKCINECSVKDRKKIVMIGDTDNDAVGAERSGIDFVGVTYGFGFKDKASVMSAGAVFSADTTEQIISFLTTDNSERK